MRGIGFVLVVLFPVTVFAAGDALENSQKPPHPRHEPVAGSPMGNVRHDECVRDYWDNKIAYHLCLKQQLSFGQYLLDGKAPFLHQNKP